MCSVTPIYYANNHRLTFILLYRSTDSSGSEGSNSGATKDSKVYITKPHRSAERLGKASPVPSHVIPSHPYTPDYSGILINQSEMDMMCLMKNFGEKFSESFCTPRIVTLDLSEELGLSGGKKFYLVLVQRAEGKEHDRYRYCYYQRVGKLKFLFVENLNDFFEFGC